MRRNHTFKNFQFSYENKVCESVPECILYNMMGNIKRNLL